MHTSTEIRFWHILPEKKIGIQIIYTSESETVGVFTSIEYKI